MSNKKISELSPLNLSELDSSDYIPVYDASTGETKKIPIDILKQLTTGRYCVKKGTSGTTWYEIYNDGWVRQGGRIPSHTTGNGAQSSSWIVAIRDTSSLFSFNMIAYNTGLGGAQQNLSISSWTTTNFSYYTNDGQTGPLFWNAEGYGSVSALAALGVTVVY